MRGLHCSLVHRGLDFSHMLAMSVTMPRMRVTKIPIYEMLKIRKLQTDNITRLY